MGNTFPFRVLDIMQATFPFFGENASEGIPEEERIKRAKWALKILTHTRSKNGI